MKWMVFLLVLLVPSFALAQDVTLADLQDPTQFFLRLSANPITLGFLIFGLVASGKRALEQRSADQVAAGGPPIKVARWVWQLLAFTSGLLISLALHAVTGAAMVGGPGWGGAAIYGLLAGLLAILGRDGLKTIFSYRPPALVAPAAVLVPVPTPQPAPAVEPGPDLTPMTWADLQATPLAPTNLEGPK